MSCIQKYDLLIFKKLQAIPEPFGCRWPLGKPVWSGASGSGDEASKIFTSAGTNYIVSAECGNTKERKVDVLKVDIEQSEVILCYGMSTNVKLNLSADSFLGDGVANWSSEPEGISGVGSSITFNVSGLIPTTYVVKASSSILPYCQDTCSVVVLQIITETISTIPANRSRKLVGIGEEVKCYTIPSRSIEWGIDGNGELSHSYGTFTIFTAGMNRSNATVYTILSDGRIEINFDVVTPDGILVYHSRDWGFGEEGNDLIGAKSLFDVYITPTTVSFYNVRFREHIPGETWMWPDGTFDNKLPEKVQWSVDQANWIEDISLHGPVVKDRIFNGTNYVDFLFYIRVPQEYENAEGEWISFFNLERHGRWFRGSDLKSKVGIEASNTAEGGWMGPWKMSFP